MRRAVNGMNAINWQQASYPDADYRYLFYMEDPVDTIGLLDFRNVTTWPLQEQGRKQAKEMLEMGEGTGFRALKDWREASNELQAKHDGSFLSYLRSYLII